MRFIPLATTAVLLLSATVANAAVVFSENFNSAAFVGGGLLLNDSSDRFGPTDYFFINNANGWTFGGGAYLAQKLGTSDNALLLNENGATLASRIITGLTAGQSYTLSLLLSGDNFVGAPYQFLASVDGNQVFNASGTVLPSGTNPGLTLTATFVAAGSTATLDLSEIPLSGGSPIVDNIVIATVPEPATWGLMIAGFGMVGFAARRRRSTVVAA